MPRIRKPCLGCNRLVSTVTRGRCFKCVRKSHGGTCTVPGCVRTRGMKGTLWSLCKYHRNRQRLGLVDWDALPIASVRIPRWCVECLKRNKQVKVRSKTLCAMHHTRAKKGHPLAPPPYKNRPHGNRVCKATDCLNKVYKGGVCSLHNRAPNSHIRRPWMRKLRADSIELMCLELKTRDVPLDNFLVELCELWASQVRARNHLAAQELTRLARQQELQKHLTNQYKDIQPV